MTPVLPAGAAAPVTAPPPAAGPPARSFGAVLQEHAASLPGIASGARTPCHPRAAAVGVLTHAAPSSPALRTLEAVDRARARLDAVLGATRAGRTFTAQELLGLQAEAYRTVQTVDLAMKVAEQGAQSVRQALATQV